MHFSTLASAALLLFETKKKKTMLTAFDFMRVGRLGSTKLPGDDKEKRQRNGCFQILGHHQNQFGRRQQLGGAKNRAKEMT